MAKKYKKASDIKVAVVGYGGAFNMGKSHLNMMQAAGMTPAAVIEIDKDRLKVAETDFPGIETYSSVAAMLKKSEVDLVTIITPHNTHAKLAVQCLAAGRHVVTEKPFAITTAECDRMISEAKKNKLMLSTFHNRHWDGWILEALKHINAGKIGQIIRVDATSGGYGQPRDWWRTSKSISGGILYDWGVHILEYILQALGDDQMVEVSGFAHNGHWAPKTRWKNDTNEDEANAVVRFKSGAMLNLRLTAIDTRPRPDWVTFTGTKGTYVMNSGGWELVQQKGQNTVITKGPNPPGESQKYYDNISAHLTKGETLVITPELARRPIHILDLADKSAKQGKAMKVKYK